MKLTAKFTAIIEGNKIKGSIDIECNGTWQGAIEHVEAILGKTMTKVYISEIGVTRRVRNRK